MDRVDDVTIASQSPNRYPPQDRVENMSTELLSTVEAAVGADVAVHNLRSRKLTEPGDNFATEVVCVEAEVTVSVESALCSSHCVESTLCSSHLPGDEETTSSGDDDDLFEETPTNGPRTSSDCHSELPTVHISSKLNECRLQKQINEKMNVRSNVNENANKCFMGFPYHTKNKCLNSKKRKNTRASGRRHFSCVAKLNSKKNCDFFKIFSKFAFENEVFFYTEILPVINSELTKASSSDLSVPMYLNSSLKPNDEVLLMEDIRQSHFRMLDKKVGLDTPRLCLVIKELAKLHASSHILLTRYKSSINNNASTQISTTSGTQDKENNLASDPNQRLTGLAETGSQANSVLLSNRNGEDTRQNQVYSLSEKVYRYLSSPSYIRAQGPVFKILVGLVKKRIMTALDVLENESDVTAAKQWLTRTLADVPALLLTMLGNCQAEFLVLCHGDLWTNNFMFTDDKAALVDFQVHRPGSLCTDLTYLLYTCYVPYVSMAHVQPLLDLYYEHFQTLLHAAGLQIGFSRAALTKAMREVQTWGALGALLVLPMVFPPDEAPTTPPTPTPSSHVPPSTPPSETPPPPAYNPELVLRYKQLFAHLEL